MGLQKYNWDKQEPQIDGSIHCINTKFMFGPTLAVIKHCTTPFGPRTVYVRGEADTYFTLPAACEYRRRVIKGSLMYEDGKLEFHPYRGEDSVFPFVIGNE